MACPVPPKPPRATPPPDDGAPTLPERAAGALLVALLRPKIGPDQVRSLLLFELDPAL
jgi:hypothetical protein